MDSSSKDHQNNPELVEPVDSGNHAFAGQSGDYENYTPSEHPDGIIRELRIPPEMVVDLSRPKIIVSKPDPKETALRAICALSWLLLIAASAAAWQASPRPTNAFWFSLTDTPYKAKYTTDGSLLRGVLFLCAAVLCGGTAGLPLVFRVGKQTVFRSILLLVPMIISIILFIFAWNSL